MLATEAVTVLRPVEGPEDSYGAPALSWEPEPVAGALVAPRDAGASSDLGPGRPNGTTRGLTVHMPASVAGSLRGCLVEARGRRWRVVGDPEPYTGGNCPLPWARAVEVEAVDG